MVAAMVKELCRSTNKPTWLGKIIYLPNSPKPSGFVVANLPELFYQAAAPAQK